MQILPLILFGSSISHSYASLVDLTSANRRPAVNGLPDWTQAGYEKGLKPLPDDSLVAKTVTAAQLASAYGVIPNDGQDDTDGLQKAIQENGGSENAFTVIQLPAGTINLSHTIYLSSNYLILRGAGNDPSTGTVLSFSPDDNTKYDVLTSNGANWDLDGMSFSWDYREPANTSSGEKEVKGSATSGWLWPGRSVFRIGSQGIADKFKTPASLAPPNRIDFFYGTVNYHWRNDTKIAGYMADQTKEIAGFAGTRKIYVDMQNSSWGAHNGSDIWLAVPVRSADYDSWQVQDKDYYQNEYMFQDWFTATNMDTDEDGTFVEVDHDLAFDVWTNSLAGGSAEMQNDIYYAKVMPIDEPVHHVGIENLYITQPMPSLAVADAVHNYGNMAPESAMHGVVFRYARDSWIRNIRTFMTGSHPIATEAARYIQVQDNYFEGAWNKGAGGNGYLRGSRVWDSLYYNNTLRNLRHFTFQWCSMRNVATMQNMTNDMNMHGGYEGYNLLELNLVTVPFEHAPGNCKSNCGGEGGSQENGTWAPIYWSTGSKASKWSGATGPQNVFYRNYMLKAFTAGSDQVEYQPYFAKDGSLSPTIWQFGWDRNSPQGTRYQHLSNDGGKTLLLDWEGHEQDRFMDDPNVGVNGLVTDPHTSLFFRDLSNATGVPTFSSIAGYAYCLGKVPPKIVGYYLGGAATRQCLPWGVDAIDVTTYTHVIYAYATLASDGTVSLTSAQQAQVKSIVALKSQVPDLGVKVFIGVGGWGLGMDATGLVTIATSSSGRTKFGTTALSLLNSVGADGIDIEWSPCVGTKCISANQFSVIASAVKTGIGSKLLSLSTSNDFWSLSGVNTVTTGLANIVEFISIITHQKSSNTDQDANDPRMIQSTLANAQSAGMPPTKLLLGVPFYSRPLGSSTLQSSCLSSTDLGQGTFPYYSVDSLENGLVYEEDSSLDFTDLDTDPVTSIDRLVLNDGSPMFAETPQSVAARSRLSGDLCMGGVAVFSIDQDNALSDLTDALFAPGGLLPNYDEVMALFDIQGITGDGFVSDSAYSDFSNQLSANFPFLSVNDKYVLLLLGALDIQRQISIRLQSLLSEKDLSADNFALYKKWETKASNFEMANITGLGYQHWTCTGNGKAIPECPGGWVEDSSRVFSNSAHFTTWDHVDWTLSDEAGYKQYLNDTAGINLDDLVTASLDVTRPYILGVCASIGARVPSASQGNTSDATGNRRREDPGDDGFTYEEELDPDPDCHTTWNGIRLIDPSSITNPVEIINNFTATTDNALTSFRSLAFAPDVMQTQLISMIQSTLTSIALGNQTIGATLGYIQEVENDKILQKEFDEAHARVSVGKIVENVVLALLSFIPGVGEISDLVLGGLDAFSAISKFVDLASLAKTIDEGSSFFQLVGKGFTTIDDIAVAADDAEAVVVGSEANAFREGLGEDVLNVQESIFQCNIDNIGAFVMASLSIGTSSFRRPSASRSPPPLKPSISSNGTSIVSLLQQAAAATNNCIFKVTRAKHIKISSKQYRARCTSNNFPMEVPDSLTNPTTTADQSFTTCTGKYKGRCQCDHLLEPDEFVSWLKSKGFTDAEKDALCNAIGGDSRGAIRDIFNKAENLAGLFGDNTAGGHFNPNVMKNNLLNGYTSGKSLQVAQSKYKSGRNLMFDVASRHIDTYSGSRQAIAGEVDSLLGQWSGQIANSGDSVAQNAFGKLYDSSNTNPMTTLAKGHEENAKKAMDKIKGLPDASSQPAPDDDDSDDDTRRSKGKRGRTASDVGCGSGKQKRLRK